jgi:hypothetical protein
VLLFGALNEAGFALARGEPELDLASALAGIASLFDGLAALRPGRTGP